MTEHADCSANFPKIDHSAIQRKSSQSDEKKALLGVGWKGRAPEWPFICVVMCVCVCVYLIKQSDIGCHKSTWFVLRNTPTPTCLDVQKPTWEMSCFLLLLLLNEHHPVHSSEAFFFLVLIPPNNNFEPEYSVRVTFFTKENVHPSCSAHNWNRV